MSEPRDPGKRESAPPEPSEAADPTEPDAPGGSHIASAQIFCDSCRRETAHRILRVVPGGTGSGTVRGVARCKECRLTHPFESAPEAGEFLDHVPLADELRADVAFNNAVKHLGLPKA